MHKTVYVRFLSSPKGGGCERAIQSGCTQLKQLGHSDERLKKPKQIRI
jgi:hypothetical protein